jgi:hypothetical protein
MKARPSERSRRANCTARQCERQDERTFPGKVQCKCRCTATAALVSVFQQSQELLATASWVRPAPTPAAAKACASEAGVVAHMLHHMHPHTSLTCT